MNRTEFKEEMRRVIDLLGGALSEENCALMIAANEISEYILENLILGKITVGEQISIHECTSDLKTYYNIGKMMYTNKFTDLIWGKYIDEDNCVKCENKEESTRYLFDKKIKKIHSNEIVNGQEYKAFYCGTYEMFCKVMETPVSDNETTDNAIYKEKASKLREILCNVYPSANAASTNTDEYKYMTMARFDFCTEENRHMFMTKLMKRYL